MSEKEHQYKKINSIKAIIENVEGKVLLIQEPETDEWMPLHWGLPGGRPKLKESLFSAFKRTLEEEIGAEIEPLGIYKIEEVLHEERTVLMFIAIAKAPKRFEIKGRIKDYKWVSSQDIEKIDTSEFTAFYAKKLLLDFLAGNREFVDFGLIETQGILRFRRKSRIPKMVGIGKKGMINPIVKLSKQIFKKDIEKVATRQGYGEGLVEAGKKDRRIVALCADLTESTRTELFKDEFPERFIEVGVAEQNLATLASGMANYGQDSFYLFVCGIFAGAKLGAD
jgi:ADP-ribose pyrophosphatase YjhB (NUDIX family)